MLGERWGRDPTQDTWLEQLWVLGLLLAALLLYSMNLGEVPLRDWDEGIVAQVARSIWQQDLDWLYPTLAGDPYFNKPPVVHLLIAVAYRFGGVSEWTTRWPPAMLTALSVPLLYGIAREVFARRTPAVFAALSYLTMLPVVRHGRLAMLDGPALCFFLLMLWCALRARRDLRYSLGVGVGLGLVCFTKGILGLLLAAIVALFMAWDTPRVLRSGYLWAGLVLGLGPVSLWYTAQWLHYGDRFLTAHLVSQSFERIWAKVEGNTGPPWYYLLELLKYGWPWLLFCPQGFRLAWKNRNLGWAKLVLIWSAGYFLVISLMSTKLPWYVLPIYPALALVSGAQLGEIWHRHNQRFTREETPPILSPSPQVWVALFSLLAMVGLAGCLYYSGWGHAAEPDLQLTFGAVALTMAVVAVLMSRQNPQFIIILFWGCYVSLSVFVTSDHWVWELGEHYPVKPVAQLLAQSTPPGEVVYTSYPYNRPSLNFYSDRQVLTASTNELLEHWQQETQPFLLLDTPTLNQLPLKDKVILGNQAGWSLVTRRD